tara:strand:- start:15 stop:260 length:246 start_codon:yes stop_codon:yes gene_type:complete
MTPAEVLTEIKQRLIQDGMIATEEAAQSYVNSRESEWDVTEDIISEVGEDFVVQLYMQCINDELQESLRSRLVQDKTEFFN